MAKHTSDLLISEQLRVGSGSNECNLLRLAIHSGIRHSGLILVSGFVIRVSFSRDGLTSPAGLK